jgi:hypothetical protein
VPTRRREGGTIVQLLLLRRILKAFTEIRHSGVEVPKEHVNFGAPEEGRPVVRLKL